MSPTKTMTSAQYRRHVGLAPAGSDKRAADAALDSITPGPTRKPKYRDGANHNDAIAAALDAAGFGSILNPYSLLVPLKMIYVRELSFHPTRGWRFDFALPFATPRFAIEREGQVHAMKAMMARDREKGNEATRLGWLTYRVRTPEEAVACARAALEKSA